MPTAEMVQNRTTREVVVNLRNGQWPRASLGISSVSKEWLPVAGVLLNTADFELWQ